MNASLHNEYLEKVRKKLYFKCLLGIYKMFNNFSVLVPAGNKHNLLFIILFFLIFSLIH